MINCYVKLTDLKVKAAQTDGLICIRFRAHIKAPDSIKKKTNTMWTDNETAQNFLNFGSVARTVAEVIEQAQSRPISIGVSWAWGVDKSSMIKLVRRELENQVKGKNQQPGLEENASQSKFIFVEFNAWLYQGYDDAQ